MENINKIKQNSEISVKKTSCIEGSRWIDVRCPREFLKGHYTNAINIPIFSDKEYEKLGIIYRTQGQKEAIDLGKEYAKRSKADIISQILKVKSKKIFIYCARGGMRSKGFEKLIKNTNLSSYRIKGGYKSVRMYILESLKIKRNIIIIYGL